ncbi:MAG: membrane-bound lytic murein transglycosylase MltF [Wenzhouxiangellaceae bacterium]
MRALFALLVFAAATSGTPSGDRLDRLRERGSLVMLTVNGAATYFLGPDGEAGVEYDLARAFAEWLGLGLEVLSLPAIDDLIPALENGRGDFIAASFSRTPERQRKLRFGPAYREVRPVVVYRRGQRRPERLADLAEGRLVLVSGTSYERFLAAVPGLHWETVDDSGIEDIFEAISNEEIDYTIVDSHILDLNRRYFPAIQPAFEVDRKQALAWAAPLEDDDTLTQKMREFFALDSAQAQLAEILDRYFSHVESYEPVGTFTFMRHMRERLPALRGLFESVAEQTGFDWRLLAAISYQESHWDPDAVSRTGVRGLMMLTQRTARQLGVTDRRDPVQSVTGGARYLRSLIERLPERIPDPDRLWLALAAYNIGLGHLEDARILTERAGGNPDRWADVREHLPLLTQPRYFSQTRFGYARGYEAVTYVENIRTFYEILVWMDSRDHPLLTHNDDEAAPAPDR